MDTREPRSDSVTLIRLVAEFMHELSEPQIDDLLEGRSKLAIKPASRNVGKSSQRKKIEPSKEELREALDRLYSIQSREEGETLLSEQFTSKAALEALARHADLPVQRRDTISSLRSRIIESTIGYRLRSQAIQGNVDYPTNTGSNTEPSPG